MLDEIVVCTLRWNQQSLQGFSPRKAGATRFKADLTALLSRSGLFFDGRPHWLATMKAV
jgi:hypothetical protein